MNSSAVPASPHASLKILLPMLAAVIAISPLAIDMYLPAMSNIAAAFQTELPLVQQSMSVYLAGYAAGMLLFGPLADKLGRRVMMRVGLTGFMLASAALAMAPDIGSFLVARAVQAFFGSAATVVVPGYVRQLYGQETAKGMSYVSLIMMLAPLIAPTLGSGIMHLWHWQGIFVLLTVYAAILISMSWLVRMPAEPHRDPNQAPVSFFGRYKRVFGREHIGPKIGASMLTSFAFFTYLTGAPMLYMEVFGLSSSTFAIIFGCNVGALMLANLINTRLVSRLGSKCILKLASMLACSLAILLLFSAWQSWHIWLQMILVASLIGAGAVASVNADALILMQFSEETGTATAVMSTLKFGGGALAGPILAAFHSTNAMPFAAMMMTTQLLVLSCYFLGYSKHNPAR
ncbi:multidrug effflux MFS transporter [Shewanella corallii]|nr:multidrug effflux MFS transporter [Shewanella corallii]